jgi:hypothetical protein
MLAPVRAWLSVNTGHFDETVALQKHMREKAEQSAPSTNKEIACL